MEQVYVTATQRFVNGVVGDINRGQRFPCSARVAYELEAMGLVTRDDVVKQLSPVAGTAKPLQSSPVVQASPETTQSAPEASSESLSTTATESQQTRTFSTPATADGGTPTKRKRGRPSKASAGRET